MRLLAPHIAIACALISAPWPSAAAPTGTVGITVRIQASSTASEAPGSGSPASTATSPRLVAFDLGPELTLKTLLGAGLDVVEVRDGAAFVLEWPRDRARLARLGASPRLIDPNPGASAAARTSAEIGPRVPSDLRTTGSLPPFGAGSMGGFWTGDEIALKLASLVAEDLRGLVADRIDTLGWSREGRPLLGLAIGNNAQPLSTLPGGASRRATPEGSRGNAAGLYSFTDPRPVVFLNALVHAREPAGMQALFYFIDDLLAAGPADPFALHLLDQRILYIVPLANPDGYAINESTYVENGGASFGMWRKNTRDNDASGAFTAVSDGVDLNRNFGEQWGYDDYGSSPDSTSDIFRGPAAWSESETAALRDAIDALAPATSFSFHSYSDLLIHPWGFTSDPTPDRAAFDEWSDAMTRDNGYLSGDSPETIYAVNGDYVDFAYAGEGHAPCMAWAPEVGSFADGFWPPPSRITPLAQEMVHSCRVLAAIAGPWVRIERTEILEGAMNAGRAASLAVAVRNRGLRPSPALNATLVALDAGARVLNGAVAYLALASRSGTAAAAPFQVALDDTVTPGRLMRFAVRFAGTATFSIDTLIVPAGTPTIRFADGASAGLSAWTPGTWGIVSNDPAHPSRYFADSPAGNYGPGSLNTLRLNATLDLSQGVHAYAVYDARWVIQSNTDGAIVATSLNGTNWRSAEATGTTPGVLLGIQTPGAPFYAGTQRGWRTERADLSPHTGPAASAVRLRFRMLSNAGTQYDGFAFDSLRIELYDPAAQPLPVAVTGPGAPAALELAAPAPNPARDFARFTFALPRADVVRLEILDLLGRRVRTLAQGPLAAGRYVRGWDRRDEHHARVAPGVYLVRLESAGRSIARRVIVLD